VIARGGALSCAAALAASVVACRAGADRPGVTLLPDMLESRAWEAYDPSPMTGGPATAPLPPDGTVAMGAVEFGYGSGDEEAERAGRELQNPFPASPEVLARGRLVYERICFVCHGTAGEGDGPIIGRFPNPASLVAARARQYPDGRIFHVITRGQGIMPSHALQVLPDDRWKVILYVRQLQLAKPLPDADARGEEAPR